MRREEGRDRGVVVVVRDGVGGGGRKWVVMFLVSVFKMHLTYVLL